MPEGYKGQRRGQPLVLLVGTLFALIAASLPVTAPVLADWNHQRIVNADTYKATKGHWDIVNLPNEFKTNTIHAATLPTGKVLLVAGSGNNRDNFNAYHDEGRIAVLKTALFDPETNQIKLIKTPSDLFCSGHAMLQSGNLLVAGGTSGYELLDGQVKKPAGAMTVHNENPDDQPRNFKKGTKFVSSTGKTYVSTQDIVLPPATKMTHDDGSVMVHHSSVKVFVEATSEDASYINPALAQYKIAGLKGLDAQNIYGQGGPMTLDKQDFRGDDKSYEFDPFREEYVEVGDMNESRWYASLPVLDTGDVLAVSGLDAVGKITTTTERYSPITQKWTWGPDRALPTYPALFKTTDPKVLFYSGSSAGYGPEDVGREPGFWNYETNTFTPVTGLRDQNILETSGSVILPPTKGSNDGSQSYRVMLAGGGGIGESPLATARTDIIDLAAQNPSYAPGPNLPLPLRYINLTVTPWDEVFANGGSRDYRAKGNSYSYKSFSINPTDNTVTPLADEIVGRTYHSGSLLLRDGRILVFGGDPLYKDKDNTVAGTFEQRLEIYTPPQLFGTSARPVLENNDMEQVYRGQTLSIPVKNGERIKTARLIPPSSTTHVTNVEQRSVGAVVTVKDGRAEITLPSDQNILPRGWYMLFVVNNDGTPSRALMVEVDQ